MNSELLAQLQQLGDGEIDDLSIAHDASEEIVALRLRVAELEDHCTELGHVKDSWFRLSKIHYRKMTFYEEAMQQAMDLLDQKDPQCCAAYAALRNAKRNIAPVSVTEWQPIETAPHEVEVLLGWREWDGKWKAEVAPASWGWTTRSVSNISRHGQATRWMPLPEAPTEKKE